MLLISRIVTTRNIEEQKPSFRVVACYIGYREIEGTNPRQ